MRTGFLRFFSLFFLAALGLHPNAHLQAAQLSNAQKQKLHRYASACARYFTSPHANDRLAGWPHTFFGTGTSQQYRHCESDTGVCFHNNFRLTRGFGSHVNINEVTLGFLSLAVAYKMGWLPHIPAGQREAQSWGQILRGLQTLRSLQTSSNSRKYHLGTFHRAYITTIERNGQFDLDRTPHEIEIARGPFEQSSDDNGLPYMNLLMLEGLAQDSSVAISQRQQIIQLCQDIRANINLSRFIVNNSIVFNFVNGQSSAGAWDRRGAEGAPILAALLLSGQINKAQFESLAQSVASRTVNWTANSGAPIPIKQTTFHAAMFIPGLRSLHGLPTTPEEGANISFYQDNVRPTYWTHRDFAFRNNLTALGTQAMTQSLQGYPMFEYWSGSAEFQGSLQQAQFPGNEQNRNPDPNRIVGGGALARGTAPHGFFVPLSRWRHLAQSDIDLLFQWMSAYEGEFFHEGSDTQLGWEAVIPWVANHPNHPTTHKWVGGGRTNYSDWGRPYEALNASYIILHSFDALNPDKPLAAYNVEALRLKHIAAFLDNGVPLPSWIDQGVPDVTTPQTTAAIHGPHFRAFNTDLISPLTQISLAAQDPAPNPSGVAQILMGLDDQLLQPYTQPFSLPAGRHALRFKAIDEFGNEEALQTLVFHVAPWVDPGVYTKQAQRYHNTVVVDGSLQSRNRILIQQNGSVAGDVVAPRLQVNPAVLVSGQRQNQRPDLGLVNLLTFTKPFLKNNDNAQLPTRTQKGRPLFSGQKLDLVLQARDRVQLPGGTYVLNSITLHDRAVLRVAGPVRILLLSHLKVMGRAKLGHNTHPQNLVILGLGSEGLVFNGRIGQRLNGIYYFPNRIVRMKGRVRFKGSLLAKRLLSTGSTQILGGVPVVAVPQPLGPASSPSKPAVDSTFKLGEVYVFPNPAKRGVAPKIHFEVGQADGVEWRIYDLTGRLVHEVHASSPPQIIDAGKGARLAYEIPWHGSIPSGTYFYTVTAEKNGEQAIQTSGKFSVVR